LFYKLQKLKMNKEIKRIFFAAFLVRLIAVVFSKGYGMHDDHFVAIEGPLFVDFWIGLYRLVFQFGQ
jgi:hypothetical protein